MSKTATASPKNGLRGLSIKRRFSTPGVHPFSELNANFDSNFVDGGTGSITVVPEPASLGLLFAGAGFLIRRRR